MVYSGPARLVFRSVFSDFAIFYKALFQWEGAPFFLILAIFNMLKYIDIFVEQFMIDAWPY